MLQVTDADASISVMHRILKSEGLEKAQMVDIQHHTDTPSVFASVSEHLNWCSNVF